MTTKDFSNSNYENTPGNHVYIPDLKGDYRSIYTGKILKVISNPNPDMETEVVNHISLPPFCTATNNPGPKSNMVVRYLGKKDLIEVFTFEKYINSFIGHMMVRDVEYLTQEFAREITTALGQGCEVEAYYDLVGFKYGQGVTVKVKTTDKQAQKWREEYPAKYEKYLEEAKAKKEAEAQARKEAKDKDSSPEKSKCPIEKAKQDKVKKLVDDYVTDTYDSQVGYEDFGSKLSPQEEASRQEELKKYLTEKAKEFLNESYDDQVGYGIDKQEEK